VTGSDEPGWVKTFGSIEKAQESARMHPVYGEEIRKLDAQLNTGTLIPYHDPVAGARRDAELEDLRRKLVAAALAEPATERRGAKELGIPEVELWWIIERRLEMGSRASRKWLADETKRRQELTYVPRDRLSPLVDWIDGHPDAARPAARLRRIPSEFRAGTLGPLPPGA
jgi:hypothetical protein